MYRALGSSKDVKVHRKKHSNVHAFLGRSSRSHFNMSKPVHYYHLKGFTSYMVPDLACLDSTAVTFPIC